MKKLLVTLMCVVMVIALMPAVAFADEAESSNITKKTASEFMELADEQGQIQLTEDITITGKILIEDGKDYVLDCNGHTVYTAIADGDSAFVVKKGSLTIKDSSAIPNDVPWNSNTDISTDMSHAIVIDGESKSDARVRLEEGVRIFSKAECVMINGGTFECGAELCVSHLEGDEGPYPDGFKIVNKDKAKVALFGGAFSFDPGKDNLAPGYTIVVDPPMGGERYSVFPIPQSDEEAIKEHGALSKDENGYYYCNLDELKGDRIANVVRVIYTDNNGEFTWDEHHYTIVKKGMSISEAYTWLFNGKTIYTPEAKNGYHFAGWYKIDNEDTDIIYPEYIYDENGDLVFDENGIFLSENGKVKKVGKTKVDIDENTLAEDFNIATKWCKDGNNKVVNAKAATYEAEGYTGDTVCAECGLLVEKGKAIPKLVKEEIKVEVKPEDGKIEVSEAPVVDGKVDVTDAIKDAVKEVVENVEAKKTEVVISVAKVEGDVKKVELPVASVNEIADAKKALTVETKIATVTLDSKALSTVAGKAQGDTLSLQVQEIKKEALSDKQKAALKDIKADIIISAEIICEQTNKVISSDFGGGKATVKLPFEAAEGSKLSDYTIVYIANDGSMLRIPTKVVDGALVFEIEHFSEYAVVKTADVANVPVAGETPKTGDSTNMLTWLALMAVAGAGAAVLRKKETNK